MKYVCDVCGWEYDESVGIPEQGIAPGTKFEDLPEDFVCPLCGVGKRSVQSSRVIHEIRIFGFYFFGLNYVIFFELWYIIYINRKVEDLV